MMLQALSSFFRRPPVRPQPPSYTRRLNITGGRVGYEVIDRATGRVIHTVTTGVRGF